MAPAIEIQPISGTTKNYMPLLSIVIINYNTFKITAECIESIYAQTSKELRYEIVLVDNASKECDPQLFATRFPGIKLIPSKENLGFSGGCNLGIQHSAGDIILLLNSDTILVEDTLSYCCNYFLASATPIALTCKLIFPDNTLQYQCSRFPDIQQNLIELFRIDKLMSKEKRGKMLLSYRFNHEETIQPDWFWGTFFMFKKSLLEQLPGKKLDETYFMYCEDMKWCYDLTRLGVKMMYLAETKIIHIGGSSSNDLMRLNNITKNELKFIKTTKGRLYELAFALVRSVNVASHLSFYNLKIALFYLKNI